MVKTYFNRQSSYEDAYDATINYEDDHYEEFYDLLFNQLLTHIRKIPFDSILNNRLMQSDNNIYKTKEAHSLFWLYSADQKIINSITIYSFRFANACNPELYRTFETKAHHLFLRVNKQRHRCGGWYKYCGQDLLDQIDRYLNIKYVTQNDQPHQTKLYINQKEERLDIQFDIYSLKKRISITFEPGYPANGSID